MFVRWQTRGSQRWGVYHRAILVESLRVEGEPRQKHIAYLGSFYVDRPGAPRGWDRPRFWHDVRQRLAELGLPQGERRRIVDAIAKHVGAQPTKAEYAKFKRGLAALWGGKLPKRGK